MDKQSVIEFFDRLAPQWDAEMIRSDEIIDIILDNAGVKEGKDVLDVACGTGVLIPDYLKRNAASVTAIDISPKMAELARKIFPQEKVEILCERLIVRLTSLIKPGGIVTVAHGMSREKIDGHHSGMASKVSRSLMSAEDLAAIFSRGLTVTTVLSNDRMYQVAGKKV